MKNEKSISLFSWKHLFSSISETSSTKPRHNKVDVMGSTITGSPASLLSSTSLCALGCGLRSRSRCFGQLFHYYALSKSLFADNTLHIITIKQAQTIQCIGVITEAM